MNSYINQNCTDCTASVEELTPCTGCEIILSDACVLRKGAAIPCLGILVDDTLQVMVDKIATYVCTTDTYVFDTTCIGGTANDSMGTAINNMLTYVCATVVDFPTFNSTCLGGESVDSMEDTINLLISAVCATPADPTYSLNWTCLTPSPSTSVTDILQTLINNIKTNQVTFGTGFTSTPQTCGSLIEYDPGASGITLTSSAATFILGITEGLSFNITPSSGVNTTYDIAPVFVNEDRILEIVAATNGTSAIIPNQFTSKLFWDKHVEFDGQIFISNASTTNPYLQAVPSTTTIPLTSLSTDKRPNRKKVFPGYIDIINGVTECTYNGRIEVETTGVVNFVVTDCNWLTDIETAAGFDSATIWVSQVQYSVI